MCPFINTGTPLSTKRHPARKIHLPQCRQIPQSPPKMPTPKMASLSALRMMLCCANTSRISHPQVYLYPIVYTHPLPFGPWYLAWAPMKERSAVDRPQEAQQVTAPQIRADGGDAPHCIAHAFLRVFHTLPVGGHPECQRGAEPGPWPPSHSHSLEKPYLPTRVTEAP